MAARSYGNTRMHREHARREKRLERLARKAERRSGRGVEAEQPTPEEAEAEE